METVYKREFAAQAAKLVALGAGKVDLADFFGVTVRAIYNWEIQRSEFAQALVTGRARLKERIERSLMQRALGYTVTSTKVSFPDASGTPVFVPFEEHVPPDPQAALVLLRLRGQEPARGRRGRRTGEDAPPETAPEPHGTVVILPHNGRD